ncbi:VWA domain-containing protein [Microlunatus sp. GCM10028923]|uniref:vWA domain-containing protein n=1 Tax=Microlunatus sp. GCM10028923 TaxID=3273400 RepID=UPI00361BB9ED
MLGVLAYALAVLGLVVLPATPAAAKEKSAIEVFGGCLMSQQKGDLVVLMDESGSLKTTDPDGARVTAAGYLLNQLEAFTGKGKVALDVSVAGFASDYNEVGGWVRLAGDGTRTLTSALDSFRDRNSGYETDYWNGLNGARQALAARTAKDPDRCQAIVWFTDGTLDLDLRRTAEDRERYGEHKPYAPDLDLDTEDRVREAETTARRDLCRPGGLADQLRGNRVTLFAIGLRGADAKASDFDTMRSIATGASGEETCGKITEPPPGEFTLASNIDDLLFAFDRLRDPSSEPTQTEAGVCQGEVCRQRHAFVLDNSLNSVHILGSANVDGLTVVLVRPDGKLITLKRGEPGRATELESGGIKINYSWQSNRTVSIDLARPGRADWTGQWAVVFVDPKAKSPKARSRTNIQVSGDIYPAWPDAKKSTLRAGETIKNVRFGLVNADGKAIDPGSLLGTANFGAVLTVPGGKQIVLADQASAGEITAPRTIDLTKVPPGRATLRLGLAITTAAAVDANGKRVPGTQLAPRIVDVPVTIGPAKGFPVPAGKINFGSAEGPADLTATLPVTGPGCVWAEAGSDLDIQSGPEGIGEVKITSGNNEPRNCLWIDEGKTADLPLRLTTADGGNGSLNGAVTIKLSPDREPGRTMDVKIDFTADLRRPLNPINFAAALIAALILGPGIPLGLLYLAKWLTATIPSRALLARRIPITVEAGPTGGRVLRDGGPFRLTEADFTDMVRLSNSGSRTAEADGATLRTTIGRSPFGAGFVVVTSPGLIGASSTDANPYGPGRDARLPLAVHNTWVVQHDPSGPPDRAELLIFIGADLTPDRLQAMAEDIERKVPDLVARLHASGAGPDAPVPVAAGPFDGPAPTPSTDQPFQDQPAPTNWHSQPGQAQQAPTGWHAQPGQDQPAPPSAHPQPGQAQQAPLSPHPQPGQDQQAPLSPHPQPGQDQQPPAGPPRHDQPAPPARAGDNDWSFDFDDLDDDASGPERRP